MRQSCPTRSTDRSGTCEPEPMVTELADFAIDTDRGDEFFTAYRGVRHLLIDAGARDVRMTRSVESPGRFVLLVQWDSVEQHQQFRAGPGLAPWRAAIGPFFTADPQVEHFTDVG